MKKKEKLHEFPGSHFDMKTILAALENNVSIYHLDNITVSYDGKVVEADLKKKEFVDGVNYMVSSKIAKVVSRFSQTEGKIYENTITMKFGVFWGKSIELYSKRLSSLVDDDEKISCTVRNSLGKILFQEEMQEKKFSRPFYGITTLAPQLREYIN